MRLNKSLINKALLTHTANVLARIDKKHMKRITSLITSEVRRQMPANYRKLIESDRSAAKEMFAETNNIQMCLVDENGSPKKTLCSLPKPSMAYSDSMRTGSYFNLSSSEFVPYKCTKNYVSMLYFPSDEKNQSSAQKKIIDAINEMHKDVEKLKESTIILRCAIEAHRSTNTLFKEFPELACLFTPDENITKNLPAVSRSDVTKAVNTPY